LRFERDRMVAVDQSEPNVRKEQVTRNGEECGFDA
jgi:hypothetical protein